MPEVATCQRGHLFTRSNRYRGQCRTCRQLRDKSRQRRFSASQKAAIETRWRADLPAIINHLDYMNSLKEVCG